MTQGSWESVWLRFKTLQFGYSWIGSVHIEENHSCKKQEAHRPYSHLSIRDFTLTSSQRGAIKINNCIGKQHHNSLTQRQSMWRILIDKKIIHIHYERKSEQALILHAPALPENAVYNEWQFKALVTGNQKIRKCISTDYVLHNYKVSRYSVKPFQWSCAEELFWVVSFIVVKFLSSKRGITPRKKMESKFPVDMHIYMVCPS